MFDVLYRTLRRPPIIVLTGVIAFVLLWRMSGSRESSSASVIALQLAFTPENFQAVLDDWGAAGVAHFQSTIWLDYLYPIAYAAFLAGLVAALRRERPQAPWQAVFLMPMAAAILDYIENTLHLIILTDTAHLSAPLIALASVAAALKWGLIALVFLAILFSLVSRVWRAMRATTTGGGHTSRPQ